LKVKSNVFHPPPNFRLSTFDFQLIFALVTILANAFFAWRTNRSLAALPVIAPAPACPDDAELPFVSIIVPARNEAANIERVVSSLLALDYPHYELIVVDDDSEDGTVEIVRAIAPQVRIVRGSGPAPGWAGKNYACYLGQAATTASLDGWLLFTDADTWHAPASLRSIMHRAVAQKLEAISVFTGQECRTFWERLLLPYAYYQFFTGTQPDRANQPHTRQALANGQYMLIRRDVYDRTGGHRMVRDSVIEDVALAHALKRAGVRAEIARADDLVRVRMYTGLQSLWRGFSKNAFQFVQIGGVDGAYVIGSSVALAAVPGVIIRGLSGKSGIEKLLALVAYLVPVAGLYHFYRSFRVPACFVLLHPLAMAVFQSIALDSMFRVLLRRGVSWKGRTYGKR
jgi:chlorobactene glucosyltransferase